MRGLARCVTGTVCAMLLVALGVTPALTAAQTQERTDTRRTRLRPPEGFACVPDDLTVHTGVVTGYRSQRDRTTLTIRTDDATTERVTVRHAGTDDPSAAFRYKGQPFTSADWARIERVKGAIRPGMRASAWVCADGKVLVDWGVPKE